MLLFEGLKCGYYWNVKFIFIVFEELIFYWIYLLKIAVPVICLLNHEIQNALLIWH